MNYIRTLGEEIRRRVDPAHMPAGDTSLLFDMYALLAMTRGVDTNASDVHDAWVVWMASMGEVHEAMVPYSQLPPATRAEDLPFVDAIRDSARGRLDERVVECDAPSS